MNIDVDHVCQQLRTHLNISLTKQNNISIAEIPQFHGKQHRGFMKAIFEHCPPARSHFTAEEALHLLDGDDDSKIRTNILNWLLEEKKKKSDTAGINYDSHVDSKLSDIVYIHNLMNNRANFIYNPKIDFCLSHREPMIFSRLKSLLGGEGEAREWLLNRTKDCVTQPIFMNPDRIIDLPGSKHQIFNTWDKPEWMNLYLERETFNESITYDDFPEIVREFFSHFFLTEESKDWFFSWLHNVLFNKSDILCVFVGEKGTGKTLMVEDFLSGLIGKNNILPIGEGFQNNHFQDGIQNNQLLFFDEFEVNNKIKSKLKRLLNNRGQLEAKSIQAGSPVEFKFSMIMNSNNWLEFQLDLNDRRFCTLDITNTPLKSIWSEEKIDSLCRVFADPEFQFDMISYVCNRVSPKMAKHPLRTKIFEEICNNTLSGWFQRFVEVCKYKKKFTKPAFYKNHPGKRTGETALKREILNYKQMTGIQLATIRKDPDCEWVAYSKIFDPKLVEELERIREQDEQEDDEL